MKHLSHIIIIIALIFSVSCQNSQQNRGTEGTVNDSIDLQDLKQDTSNNLKPQTERNNPKPEKVKEVAKVNIEKSNKTKKYSLRKYENVTQFYSRITKPATKICMENNVPPAAILAIAGLESGWNQGYVGRITGNILSLGTRKGDIELPALRLPRLKAANRILFDSLEILKYRSDEIIWENRPPSLKKDYRPLPYAGTKHNLAYFKYHPDQKARAHVENLTDFVTIFISRESRIKVYRDARKLMDDLVAANGKEILLKEETAIQFVNAIGGKPNSFNFRETWPVKVTTIIKKVGLADLTTELYKKDSQFDEIW